METLIITLVSALVGAVVGSAISVLGGTYFSYLANRPRFSEKLILSINANLAFLAPKGGTTTHGTQPDVSLEDFHDFLSTFFPWHKLALKKAWVSYTCSQSVESKIGALRELLNQVNRSSRHT